MPAPNKKAVSNRGGRAKQRKWEKQQKPPVPRKNILGIFKIYFPLPRKMNDYENQSQITKKRTKIKSEILLFFSKSPNRSPHLSCKNFGKIAENSKHMVYFGKIARTQKKSFFQPDGLSGSAVSHSAFQSALSLSFPPFRNCIPAQISDQQKTFLKHAHSPKKNGESFPVFLLKFPWSDLTQIRIKCILPSKRDFLKPSMRV